MVLSAANSPFVALINFNLLISYLVEFFEVIASIFFVQFCENFILTLLVIDITDQ